MVLEWKVICNPKAGNHKAEQDWPHIKKLLESQGICFHQSFSRYKYHAITLAKQAWEKGFRHFIIIGGDGSLHEIVNGIAQCHPTALEETDFALIPVGKGNDWARTYGIPRNYQKAIEIISRYRTAKQDLGQLTFLHPNGQPEERYFINMVGIGFDAHVTHAIGERFERGSRLSTFSYTWQLIKSLFQFTSRPASLAIDKNRQQLQLFTLAAGIGQFNGGGMRQCPGAIPNDDRLDFTVVHHVTKMTVIRNIFRIFNGKFVRHSQVNQYRGQSLQVVSGGNLLVEADGEWLGSVPTTIKVTGKKVQIVIP